jgi:signal transduction histidine kinase
MRFAVERLAAGATPAQREMLEIIDAESARIERMARDFTALGRLPEGPPAPVDVAELLEELARSLPPEVAARVEKQGSPAMVVGHYEPLRRAFHNLLLNACDAIGERAGTAGGTYRGEIAMRVGEAANGASPAVRVTVTDNGVGIAPDNLNRIFEPYLTTKPHGTGLGLTIVRQTVRDHGGTLEVESRPGGGTTFTLTLPAGGP